MARQRKIELWAGAATALECYLHDDRKIEVLAEASAAVADLGLIIRRLEFLEALQSALNGGFGLTKLEATKQ